MPDPMSPTLAADLQLLLAYLSQQFLPAPIVEARKRVLKALERTDGD